MLPQDKLNAYVGVAARLMARDDRYAKFPMRDLNKLVICPFSLGQFRLLKEGGNVIGFITWATLSDDIDESFSNGVFVDLKQRDWCSGEKLWFMDLVFHGGCFNSIKQHLVPHFSAYSEAKFVRRSIDGRLIKIGRVASNLDKE